MGYFFVKLLNGVSVEMEGPKWLLLLLLLVFQLNFVINTKGCTEKKRKARSFGLRDGLMIDLTSPGTTVQSGIQSALPGVLTSIQNELKTRNFVTLSFIMTTPPNLPPTYMSSAQTELINSLAKYFPDSHIGVSSTPKMDYWGYLTHIIFEVSLRRGGVGIPKVVVPDGENVINLISPNMNMIAAFRATIIKLLPKIRADLRSKNEVEFSVNVKVPTNSNPGFLETLQANLIVQLTTYFPDYNFKLSNSIHNQDVSVDVVFNVKMRKECCGNMGSMQNRTELMINLIPGATIESELLTYLPSLVPRFQAIYRGGSPASFIMDINTPVQPTREVLDDIKKQIMAIMKQHFQDAKIEISLDGTGGPFDGLTCRVELYPNKVDGGVYLPPPNYDIINLKIPGTELTKELKELFRRILPRSKKFKRIFTFNIMLIPPQLVDLDYVDQTVSKMTKMIKSQFPDCNVLIDANIKENAWGGIVDILFEFGIQPQARNSGRVEKTPRWKELTINLYQPRDNLINHIQRWLQNLMPDSKRDLENGRPVGLYFDLVPGPHTRKMGLKMSTALIMSVVILAFPKFKVESKGREVQDNKGYIKSSEIRFTIHPEARNIQLEEKVVPDKFSIDLNKPDTSVNSSMDKIIPKIFETIGNITKQDQSRLKMAFVIKPPNGSQKNVRDISFAIANYISEYFPEYYLEYFANGKTEKDNIEEILLDLVLVPGKSTAESGLLTNVAPSTFVYDVPKNDNSLLILIGKWVQSNIGGIFDQLTKTPVVLEFTTTPPNKATMGYETLMLEEMKEYLINVFHHCNIRVGISGIKDKQGFVTQMIILVTIEPLTRNWDFMEPPLIHSTKPPKKDTVTTTETPGKDTVKPTQTPGILTPGGTDTMQQPGTKPNPTNEISFTVVPDSEIEEQIRPDLRKRKMDIISSIKTGNSSEIRYYLEFPKGTNKLDLRGMVETIRSIYKLQFRNELIKINIGDIEGDETSIISAAITVVVEPVKHKKVTFDLRNATGSISENVKLTFPEIESIIRSNMQDDKENSVMINIVRPHKESSQFALELVKPLISMMESSFPDLESNLDVDISDPKKIDIIFKWTPRVTKNTHGNEPIEIVMVIDDGKESLPQRIDDKLDSLYSTLKPFVEGGKKVLLNMNMDLNPESNEISVEKIVEDLKIVLKKKFPNVVVGITPYLKRDSKNNPYYMQLEVTLQSVVGQSSSNIEAINVDFSNPKQTINAVMSEISPNIIAMVQKYLNQKEAITLNFKIIPPKRSTDDFLNTVTKVIVPLVTSPFCNSKIKWKISTNTDLEGFLIDLVLSMTLKPSENSAQTVSNECKKTIMINMTKPGTELNVEIDKILPSVYAPIIMSLEQGKTQILNFKFTAPPNLGGNYLEGITEPLKDILGNYFPYNAVGLQVASEQSREGNLNIEVTITIQPDNDPLPPANITIPIDLSQGSTISFLMKSAMKKYKSQIRALLAQKSFVTMGFQINPPKGANNIYFRKLSNEITGVIQALFPSNSISTRSKAAQNSNGEYFRIAVVVTLSNY